MITGLLFAILFIALALVFLAGKGDKLIAGYNTASEEERSKVDIHRLRILMASVASSVRLFASFWASSGRTMANRQ